MAPASTSAVVAAAEGAQLRIKLIASIGWDYNTNDSELYDL